jgi:hypothetical protein
MKLVSPPMVTAHIKNSCNSLKMWQCDWKHSDTHVRRSLLFFSGLRFCTNMNNKYEKGIFYHFFLWEKKVNRFTKNWKSCCNISLLVLVG